MQSKDQEEPHEGLLIYKYTDLPKMANSTNSDVNYEGA